MTEETTEKDMQKKDWKVVAEFWDGPHLKSVGDIVSKTDVEVQYMTPHILAPAAIDPVDPDVEETPLAPLKEGADPKPSKRKR